MGGGAILRSVARAAVSAQSARPGLASAFTSAGSSSRYGSMLQPYGAVAAPSLRLVAPADEWELVGGSGDEETHDRLIFGNMPSRDEVEDATSDLQAALGLCVGDLHDSSAVDTMAGSETASNRGKPDEVRAATASAQSPTASVHSTSVLDWIEPHLFVDAPGNVQVRRRNEVMDAFRLLQTDPTVKGVVMSIATDKAVWEAVLSNEKVKELRKKLAAESSDASAEVSDESEHGGNTFLLRILKYSKRTFQRLQSVLKDVLNSIITFADKKFPVDKISGDSTDKALKSCFMLGVMVVSVVLLKRAVVL